jgi:hypothetical protein
MMRHGSNYLNQLEYDFERLRHERERCLATLGECQGRQARAEARTKHQRLILEQLILAETKAANDTRQASLRLGAVSQELGEIENELFPNEESFQDRSN